MSGADRLQLFGLFVEACGLVLVGVGISETRSRFTDKPSLATKVGRIFDKALSRLESRLFGGRTQYIYPTGIPGAGFVGDVHFRRIFGFEGTLEERVERLQGLAQEFEDWISELQQAAKEERAEREALSRELAATEERMRDFVSSFAAGGLSREAWGVTLFLSGLGLQAAGIMVSS